jgi:glycosyltransferase involved in cell wall biosynthesis
MKNLSIIIPIYNEEKSIKETVEEIQQTLKICDISFEIIAINDGSTDNSLKILEQTEGIRVISHKQNKGYGASLKTGLRKTKYDNVCITDADSTYPNDRIPDLLDTLINNNLDMVVGSRNGTNVSYPFIKKVPKYFIKGFANYISGTKIPDINSGLRIFKKDVAMKFYNLYPAGFSFTTTITLSMICRGYDVEYVPIDYFFRKGDSKIAPIKDTIGFFSLLSKIAVFFNPMKFFMPIVLLLSLISLGFIIRDVFYNFNLSQSAVLFPILAILFFFIGLMADMISKK